MVRAVHGVLTAFVLALVLAACGSSPTKPTPPDDGPPPPPPASPTITSITLSDTRPEIGDVIQVTAKATPGNSADQLVYDWTATGGVLQGTGATVTWLAPTIDDTPAEYTITLKVLEGTGTRQTDASKTTTVRVHDSEDELGDIAMKFLKNFANSDVSADVCLQDFSDSCAGKQQEYKDVVDNRTDFLILDSSLRLEEVDVHSDRKHADIAVACSFTSKQIACTKGEDPCVIGSVGTATGTCTLTGVYQQDRWWLCDSHFRGTTPLMMRGFFGSGLVIDK